MPQLPGPISPDAAPNLPHIICRLSPNKCRPRATAGLEIPASHCNSPAPSCARRTLPSSCSDAVPAHAHARRTTVTSIHGRSTPRDSVRRFLRRPIGFHRPCYNAQHLPPTAPASHASPLRIQPPVCRSTAATLPSATHTLCAGRHASCLQRGAVQELCRQRCHLKCQLAVDTAVSNAAFASSVAAGER